MSLDNPALGGVVFLVSFLGPSPSPIRGGVDANTLHVAALQKTDSARIGLNMSTTKASVAT
jgi:hypothetical protein